METLQKNYANVIAAYKAHLITETRIANFGDKTFEFVPKTTIYNLASGNSIEEIFRFSKIDSSTLNRLTQIIRSNGIRLYATAIYCCLSPPDILTLLTKYEDLNLPLLPGDQLANSEKLADSIFDDICNAQHRFMAPDFGESQYSADFTDHPIPIEFIRGTKPDVGEGSGGRLYKARIHNSHVSFLREGEPPGDWSGYFALKVSKFRKDAERERAFLESQALFSCSHEHITTFYSGFEFEQKIYLIAELADGNLDDFMAKYPEHKAISDLDREWLLLQLSGLASALFILHDRMMWHHHDIKPANILVFHDPSADMKHRLKLTDFGSAGSGFCLNATGSSAKSKIKGTTPTLPSETHRNGSSSRPHDVWSLGCVFIDIILWYYKGWEFVRVFRSKVMEESEAWCYYDVKEGNKVIANAVLTVLEKLAPIEEELVGVIREMLEIDPGSRLNAAHALERIDVIIEQST
jgi:serine/threonine protein kinase